MRGVIGIMIGFEPNSWSCATSTSERPSLLRVSVSTLFDGVAGAIIEGVPVAVPAHS
jgi:hypothetical protein